MSAVRCSCCLCVIPEAELAIPVQPTPTECDLCLMYGDDENELKNHEAACAAEDDR